MEIKIHRDKHLSSWRMIVASAPFLMNSIFEKNKSQCSKESTCCTDVYAGVQMLYTQKYDEAKFGTVIATTASLRA